MRALFTAVLAVSFLAAPALGADRLGVRTGMSGAEATRALEGRCPDVFVGPPAITCQNGSTIITATVSRFDRVYYIRLIEPSTEAPDIYAAALAAELGFAHEAGDCAALEWLAVQRCWADASGAALLYPGLQERPGELTTYIIDPVIRSRDGED